MEKRRTFIPEFKLEVVLEVLSGAKSNAQVCQDHRLAPTMVSAWKERFGGITISCGLTEEEGGVSSG